MGAQEPLASKGIPPTDECKFSSGTVTVGCRIDKNHTVFYVVTLSIAMELR